MRCSDADLFSRGDPNHEQWRAFHEGGELLEGLKNEYWEKEVFCADHITEGGFVGVSPGLVFETVLKVVDTIRFGKNLNGAIRA